MLAERYDLGQLAACCSRAPRTGRSRAGSSRRSRRPPSAKRAPSANGVASGSLVVVPLPNGTYRVLWMLEAGTYQGFGPCKGRGYFSFLSWKAL